MQDIYYKSVGCVAGTSINTANQTSDILQRPMNNTFIMYCSCVNTEYHSNKVLVQ